MNVEVNLQSARKCKCDFKVLVLRNALDEGVLEVDMLETRTGIVFRGVEFSREEFEYSEEEEAPELSHVKFSNYSDFGSTDLSDASINLAQCLADAVSKFLEDVTDILA